MINKLEYLKTGDDERRIQIETYIRNQHRKLKPKCFYGENDIRTKQKKHFEDMITSLQEAHITNARELTVFQLYSKYDYFEQKAERMKAEMNKK